MSFVGNKSLAMTPPLRNLFLPIRMTHFVCFDSSFTFSFLVALYYDLAVKSRFRSDVALPVRIRGHSRPSSRDLFKKCLLIMILPLFTLLIFDSALVGL